MNRACVRVAGLALFAFQLVACSQAAPHAPLPRPGTVLWSADHEAGDLSEWNRGQGGSVFVTGSGQVEVVNTPDARSGHNALLLTIEGTGDEPHAARIFRWRENQQAAFYSAHLYFTRPIPETDWWNVMQFKSLDSAGVSQPTWVLNVTTNRSGLPRFYLWDALTGVSRPSSSALEDAPIPLDQWVHVEIYLERSSERDGRIALWQDGVLLFDIADVATAYGDTIHWSIDNYVVGTTPSRIAVLADDAAIRAAEFMAPAGTR